MSLVTVLVITISGNTVPCYITTVTIYLFQSNRFLPCHHGSELLVPTDHSGCLQHDLLSEEIQSTCHPWKQKSKLKRTKFNKMYFAVGAWRGKWILTDIPRMIPVCPIRSESSWVALTLTSMSVVCHSTDKDSMPKQLEHTAYENKSCLQFVVMKFWNNWWSTCTRRLRIILGRSARGHWAVADWRRCTVRCCWWRSSLIASRAGCWNVGSSRTWSAYGTSTYG